MQIHPKVLLLVCAAALPAEARALSHRTQVTPANVKDLPVELRVEAKPTDGGQDFTVSVEAKDGCKLSPFLRGELSVGDGGGAVASCAVEGSRKGDKVVYRFEVAARCLGKSTFTFCELAHSQGRPMPAGDFYWFAMKDFAKVQAAAAAAGAGTEGTEKVRVLGTVPVGPWTASVMFEFPEGDGKHYRVDVAKRNNTPMIRSDRIDVWLLARDGKSAAPTDRPRPGPLVEVNSAGTTADAMFFFSRDVKRADLVAVVVSVDGELHVFKVPGEKAKEAAVP